ncbi:MAG: bifunctional diaminohydroxyphosphoribosylaminopyrimidine deaminase/5-amino-6-(5-phosphoribosylamino)uracil reductase RibD [Solirubrobacterales bacterium]
MTSDQPSAEAGFWERAAELARRGRGLVSPNPMVGAVLVKDGLIIGEGWHKNHGGLHAEREAIADAGKRGNPVEGTTMFVTLEPCGHTGLQPPCADALIEAGVAKVVYACADPTPNTCGVGPEMLRTAGIEVQQAAPDEVVVVRGLIQDFLKRAETGRPLLVLKIAMSLDGVVATRSGDSKWISGPESRELVHRWRADLDAVAIGSGTYTADNPRLTARPEKPASESEGEISPLRQPARVIFDSGPVVSPKAALFEDARDAPVLLVVGPGADPDRLARLEAAGAEVLSTGGGGRRERFLEAMDLLGERGISSILLEGGPVLAGVALDSGEVDRFEVFVAPIVLGGGRAAVEGEGPLKVDDAMRVGNMLVTRVGQDVHMSAQMKAW